MSDQTHAAASSDVSNIEEKISNHLQELDLEGMELNEEDSSSDGGGEWITPINISRKKQLDSNGILPSLKNVPECVAVACITNDFAMQVFQSTRSHDYLKLEYVASDEIKLIID